MFRGLTESDPVTFLPRPALGERGRWMDATHYRVRVRTDAKFQDGRAVSASDVVATYESVLAPTSRSRLRGTYPRVLRSVRALDAREVEFELTALDGSLETLLQLGILPAEEARAGEMGPADMTSSARVGSGAMRVSAAARDLLTLARVAVGGSFRALDVVTLHDPNTLALRLLHGEGDVAELKPELYGVFEHRTDFEVASAPTSGVTYLGLHCEHGLLQRADVRRALGMAIDRRALGSAMLGRHAVPATGVLPPTHWAYTGDVAALPFDPVAARAALRSAGVPVGLRLVLRVSNQRFAVTAAQALAAMLADVGVELEVRPSELATLLGDLRAGRFDVALLTVPDLSDPRGLSFWFGSESIPTAENPGAGGNRWRYRSAPLDAALEGGLRSLGAAARRPHYEQAQRILAADLPVVPLWHADVVFALRRPFRGLVPRGDGQLDFLLGVTRDGAVSASDTASQRR